jgi:hypothetical protein
MLRRVNLVRTDVSEELGASFMRVTRIGSTEPSVLTRATRRNIPEDTILHEGEMLLLEFKCFRIELTVGTPTGYGLDVWGSIPGRGKIFFSTLQCPGHLRDQPCLLLNQSMGPLP